jgi:hypothetical protein
MNPIVPQKRCAKCGEEKPLTIEFWYRNSNRKNGYQSNCKACHAAMIKNHSQTERGKEQSRKSTQQYKNRHPDRIKEIQHKHNRSAKRKASLKAWRNKPNVWEKLRSARIARRQNPETGDIERAKELIRIRKPEYQRRRKAYGEAYRKRPEIKERARQQYQTSKRDPQFIRRRRVNYQVYKTRKLNLPIDFSATDWTRCLEYWGFRCAVCDRPRGFWHTLAQDHWIPLNSENCPGTVKTNIVPLCHGDGGCNNSKNDTPAEEWLTFKFGIKRAKEILRRIAKYFEWVK